VTASLGRPRPPSGKLSDPKAVFQLECQRCFTTAIVAHGFIAMECASCLAAAQAVWPWAGPISGELSGE
jgi:hypothetical protein